VCAAGATWWKASGLHATRFLTSAVFSHQDVTACPEWLERPAAVCQSTRPDSATSFAAILCAAMCLTHDISRSDLHCCYDRLPLYASRNMPSHSFHTTPCWV
jgi:hypothetical protein